MPRAHQVPRAMELCLAGADRDAEHLGGLLVAVTINAVQHDDVARAGGRPAIARSTVDRRRLVHRARPPRIPSARRARPSC
jgi:hypothetical protein